MKEPVLARDLMIHPVHRVSSRATVRDAAEFLLRHGISGAPVEDEHGRWLGVFSLNDIARAVAARFQEFPADRTLEVRGPAAPASMPVLRELDLLQVRELMTPGLVSVFPGATLGEVVHTMRSSDVHRVFVLEENKGTMQGVITTMDVVRWLDGCVSGTPSDGELGQR